MILDELLITKEHFMSNTEINPKNWNFPLQYEIYTEFCDVINYTFTTYKQNKDGNIELQFIMHQYDKG